MWWRVTKLQQMKYQFYAILFNDLLLVLSSHSITNAEINTLSNYTHFEVLTYLKNVMIEQRNELVYKYNKLNLYIFHSFELNKQKKKIGIAYNLNSMGSITQ